MEIPSAEVVADYLLSDPRLREQLELHRRSQVLSLGRGVYNLVFRLDVEGRATRVVRLGLRPVRGDLVSQAAREATVLTFLSGRDVTAELSCFEPNGPGGHPLLVMDYLAGRGLDYRTQDLTRTAATYARLHDVPGPFPARVETDDRPGPAFVEESRVYVDRYKSWIGSDAHVVELLEDALQRLGEAGLRVGQPVLTHGDASHTNWRLNEDLARLIDWDWVLITTAAADLAHFLSPITVRRFQGRCLTAEERELFLSSYFHRRRSSAERELREELRWFLPLVVLRSVAWVAAHLADLRTSGRQPCAQLPGQLDPGFLSKLRKEGLL